MAGFNLEDAAKQVAAEDEGTEVHLADAAGEPMYYGPDNRPVTVRVAGFHSKRYRDAERAVLSKLSVSKGKLSRAEAQEMGEQKMIDTLSRCILSWNGIFEDATETKPVPLTAENAAMIMQRAPWVFVQIQAAVFDAAGFTKAASAS